MLAAERVGQGALTRMRRSRLLRWRYRAPAAEELLLAPPDLRASDASFVDEVASGSLGLAGSVANLGGRSPFAVAPPSQQWARELHGFGWLRHLAAAQSTEAKAMARNLTNEWMRHGRRQAPAWEPEVVARRLLSWLAHAGLLLDDTDHRRYAAVMVSVTDQVTHLCASWRNAPDGHPRLLALMSLVCADLCICDHDPQLVQSQRLLAAELERQVGADGGHLSRNPAILVELLLDLLPLRQCFAVRGKACDPQITTAIANMTVMLRHMRLGDGTLARFNGMGTTERDALVTVLTYDEGHAEAAVRGGYARLQRGPVVAIVDAGAAPPMELAGNAGAGCLSLELSSAGEPLLVNAGMPGQAETARRSLARATASHNTLCLGEQSSAKLVRDARLERAIGSPPLVHPDNVACELRQRGDGSLELEASHDGYVEHFGLRHSRMLRLDATGSRLDGCDRLDAAKGVIRFAWDIPLAIHFHLHPDVEARVGPVAEAADLLLRNGESWRLTAAGAAVSIEEDVHFAHPAGVRRSAQVVLRADCCGTGKVSWSLERIGQPTNAKARRKDRRAGKRLTERLADTSAGFEPQR